MAYKNFQLRNKLVWRACEEVDERVQFAGHDRILIRSVGTKRYIYIRKRTLPKNKNPTCMLRVLPVQDKLILQQGS